MSYFAYPQQPATTRINPHTGRVEALFPGAMDDDDGYPEPLIIELDPAGVTILEQAWRDARELTLLQATASHYAEACDEMGVCNYCGRSKAKSPAHYIHCPIYIPEPEEATCQTQA